MEPLKVLHVIPSVGPLRGGPSVMVRQLASSLTAAGVDTHIATTNDNGPGLLDVPLGTPVDDGHGTCWYFPRQSRFYTASLPLATWLGRHVADYDVVHIHALFSFAALPASHYAHRHGVPYLVRPLGTLNEWGMNQRRPWLKRASFSLIESRIVRHAALMHYTSEAERDEAHCWTKGAPSIVVPNPVADVPVESARGAFRAAHGIEPTRPIALFLSRLDEKKGLDLLLAAFAQLRARMGDVLLVIAGEGTPAFVSSLRAQAAELGLRERDVLWAGFLSGAEKQAALTDADVFVLPSYSENFGIAAAEAMLAGLPLVVSDQVALHRDVTAANAGVVVPCESPALSAALERLLQNERMRAAMGAQGRQFAQHRYSSRAVTARIIDVYNQIVNRASRTAARTARLGTLQGHA